MTYCQITTAERYTLALLRRQGCPRRPLPGFWAGTVAPSGGSCDATGPGTMVTTGPPWPTGPPGGAAPAPGGTSGSRPPIGGGCTRCCGGSGARSRSRGGCAGTGGSPSATRPSTGPSGRTRPGGARSTSTCAGPASSTGSAMGATTVAAGWRANGRSRHDPRGSRLGNRWGIGRPTRSWERGRRRS